MQVFEADKRRGSGIPECYCNFLIYLLLICQTWQRWAELTTEGGASPVGLSGHVVDAVRGIHACSNRKRRLIVIARTGSVVCVLVEIEN